MKENFLTLNGIQKKFRQKTVLDNLDLEIKKGELVSILGASGSGKSTLLRLVADLDRPGSGQIKFASSHRTSFVFQQPTLLPWLNVKENILLPLKISKSTPVDAGPILNLVGLTQAENLFPHELSGGMQMRVSIARALITDPDLLLMDEPFAALDEITRFQLQDDLRKIWKLGKLTIIFVTHSLSEALYLSDRVVGLDGGNINWAHPVRLPPDRDQDIKSSPKYLEDLADLARKIRGGK